MELIRRQILVDGVVQGVGFRPFVYALASRLELSGFVANDTRGVLIEVEGAPGPISEFSARLRSEAPPRAMLERIVETALGPRGEAGFQILASRNEGNRSVLISPDIATCDDCVREIFAPHDRRYRYPFNNCTNCGPRFSIIRGVPYDRPLTTMASFTMCSECRREYSDPANRRFHAQPISCPDCGPTLVLVDKHGARRTEDPIAETAATIRSGKLAAVKGIGGYHLAADATNENAVAALRGRKHREGKPFAVMVRDLAAVSRIAVIEPNEARTLANSRRPIVLMRRSADGDLADSVAPGNRFIGVMLPYTPIHHLLCAQLDGPLVLTSGNISDEPIAYLDEDAFTRLGKVADVFLTHNRPIQVRVDDSVVRVFKGREMPVRRSRGYAPQPLSLPWQVRRPILACGAELKNTFCLAKNNYAFVSHHIGDLENYETLRAFKEGIEHFSRFFDIEPAVVAHDLHPEYLSTKYAFDLHDLGGIELAGIQHHHAHVAACLADNSEEGPVIGVAFDGLGYGTDSTLWGGEFLIADLIEFKRVAHLASVPMPGGAAAIRQPWRMAAAYLDAAYGGAMPADLEVIRRNSRHWNPVLELGRKGINSPLTSSVGRLFDAVAAIVGVRDRIDYEGQAAIELEQLADPQERSDYELALERASGLIPGGEIIRAVVEDFRSGTSGRTVAARFHNTLARLIVEVCCAVRINSGLSAVALSGGVFQNCLLLGRTVNRLEAAGFRVLTHNRVPTNDGGISFGQVAIAAARDF